MSNKTKPQIQLETVDPEIRSYILQVLMDLQPFTSPDTTVSVLAKDPLKMTDLPEDQLIDPEKLKSMWRISIALMEDGAQLEEEALHEDIYAAIRLAKEKLVKTLIEIQDQAISNQERFLQIRSATGHSQLH